MDRPVSGNGITVYLVEELSDARLRCEQLKRYVRSALELIEKSPHKDSILEVAGHLLHGIPEVLFRLDKALSATAMATSKMDYEMLKQSLRPEKADELENVLEDARMRLLQKRGTSTHAITPEKAAQAIEKIATDVENTGSLSVDAVGSLLVKLGSKTTVASLCATGLTVETPISAFALRKMASKLLEKNPSRDECARALEDVAVRGIGKQAFETLEVASSREEVIEGFKKTNPSLTEAQLEEIADHWERNKDNLKASSAYPFKPVGQTEVDSRFEEGKPADPTENMSEEDKKKWDKYHGQVHKLAWKTEEATTEVDARFEEGKPADPTENMSEEDKKKWDKYHGQVQKLAKLSLRMLREADLEQTSWKSS